MSLYFYDETFIIKLSYAKWREKLIYSKTNVCMEQNYNYDSGSNRSNEMSKWSQLPIASYWKKVKFNIKMKKTF